MWISYLDAPMPRLPPTLKRERPLLSPPSLITALYRGCSIYSFYFCNAPESDRHRRARWDKDGMAAGSGAPSVCLSAALVAMPSEVL